MKPMTAKETAVICVAGVVAVGLLTIPFEIAPYGQRPDAQGLINLVITGVVALAMVLVFRYLTMKKRAQLELTGGEQRRLAEEYRRLADLAITAQEHTDFKLGDVSAQLDFLRQQNESLHKILKEVE